MTSEARLREIAASHARAQLELCESYDVLESDEDGELTHAEHDRVARLVNDWPVPDLPVPDRLGYLWPEHGRNYGNVHVNHADHTEVVISRGGPGETSRRTSMYLTRTEALELASLLTAAATEGDHQ